MWRLCDSLFPFQFQISLEYATAFSVANEALPDLVPVDLLASSLMVPNQKSLSRLDTLIPTPIPWSFLHLCLCAWVNAFALLYLDNSLCFLSLDMSSSGSAPSTGSHSPLSFLTIKLNMPFWNWIFVPQQNLHLLKARIVLVPLC